VIYLALCPSFPHVFPRQDQFFKSPITIGFRIKIGVCFGKLGLISRNLDSPLKIPVNQPRSEFTSLGIEQEHSAFHPTKVPSI
jgi:hypothetical protein